MSALTNKPLDDRRLGERDLNDFWQNLSFAQNSFTVVNTLKEQFGV